MTFTTEPHTLDQMVSKFGRPYPPDVKTDQHKARYLLAVRQILGDLGYAEGCQAIPPRELFRCTSSLGDVGFGRNVDGEVSIQWVDWNSWRNQVAAPA